MVHDVFISFAFKDQTVASEIYDYLKSQGIDCFWCNDLPGGSKYGQELGKAIIASKAFLLLLSSESEASDSVYQEVMIAHNNKIKTIPVRLENISTVNLAYAVAGNLYFDLFTKPLKQRLPELVVDIKTQLGKHPPPPRPPTPTPKPPPKSRPQPGSQPKFPEKIRDSYWHYISYDELPGWVKEKDKISTLNSGRTLIGRTFIYRLNLNIQKFERKLKNPPR
jgi:TIR domain